MQIQSTGFNMDSDDPEVYFHLACVYSNMEDVNKKSLCYSI